MSSGRRLSGPRPSRSSANNGQMRLEDRHIDDVGGEGTESGDEVSHTIRGSNIPTPLPAPGDRPMIDLYADEFDDQTAIGRAITEILHFRFIEPRPAWGAVPREKDQMWLRFKLLYQWDPKKDELIRKCFMKHAANRFNGMLCAARIRAKRIYKKKNPEVPFDKDYTRLTHFNPSWMKQEVWIALLQVFNSEKWKALSEQNKKNRNTSVGGVHTCGSRSFTTTRKLIGPMGSTKFYTYAHTLKATRPPLVQQSSGSANIDGPVGEGESDGVGGSDGIDGSNGVCGSNDEGGSTSVEVDVVEPVWVNDKSREHIEKYQASMTKRLGEDVESHPHNQEVWNEITPVKRGITHGAGKSSDPLFVLTGIPSTPITSTSYPPDVVEVLQKSVEELKEARARDKELFEEAKEENKRQYEEKLKSHASTMKEELMKEANAKIAEMFAQYTRHPPIPPP